MRIAVIVTTYNRPDALAAVLEGYLAQDDARLRAHRRRRRLDRRDAPRWSRTTRARAPFPLRHVWQEDRGFRAGGRPQPRARRDDADYVIFSDGDCVPPPRFVVPPPRARRAGILRRRQPHPALASASPRACCAERVPIHRWRHGQWLAAWLRRDVNRLLPLLALPDGALRKRSPARWEGVKTCNLAAWRADLERVNGFDESYSGWGLEDSDLVIRLAARRRAGTRARASPRRSFICGTRSGIAAAWPRTSAGSTRSSRPRRIEALAGLRRRQVTRDR